MLIDKMFTGVGCFVRIGDSQCLIEMHNNVKDGKIMYDIALHY